MRLDNLKTSGAPLFAEYDADVTGLPSVCTMLAGESHPLTLTF